ncbi:MAG: ABC transporter permease [Eubacterium sp.]|nr:ABC transporter permease [Eubacterium sp.]
MNLFENMILALEGLRSNKMRALLTMLGIIIGIGSVIAIMSLGDAMTSTVTQAMENLGGKNIEAYLMPKDLESGSYTIDEDDLFTDERIAQYKARYGDEVRGVSVYTEIGAAQTVDTLPAADLKITGINEDYAQVQNVNIVSGRTISQRDVQGSRRVAVISSILAKQLFGEADPIGKTLKAETTQATESFAIVGVYQDPKENSDQSAMITAMTSDGSSRSTVYIPVSTVAEMTGESSGSYSSIVIMTASDVDSAQFAQTTAEFFNRLLPKDSSAQVEAMSMESVVGEMQSMMSTLSVAIAVIAGISLLVGGIGVMNIMLVSVTERTREIGIRKALGARNSAIRIQFIVESIIICVIGGIFGILLGSGLAALGGVLMEVAVVPSVSSILIAVIFSMVIGVFFGYYPANKAAKLDPIEALRYE